MCILIDHAPLSYPLSIVGIVTTTIAIDIVTTLRGSINCSTVICSPTVIFAIMREASSEHYGPQGLVHTIFSALHFFYFVALSAFTSHFANNLEGINNPFEALGASFFVFVQLLWT